MAASTLRLNGTAPIDVVVVDVSESGVRIVTNADLEIGQEISIGLAGAGSSRAYVVWRRADHYGCAFERPIGPEGAARAFSRGSIVHLGAQPAEPQPAPQASASADYLRDLYVQHLPWKLPLDAIIASLVIIGGLAALCWWMLHG
jgi:hypothetical protein